jgi:hypothetical protein
MARMVKIATAVMAIAVLLPQVAFADGRLDPLFMRFVEAQHFEASREALIDSALCLAGCATPELRELQIERLLHPEDHLGWAQGILAETRVPHATLRLEIDRVVASEIVAVSRGENTYAALVWGEFDEDLPLEDGPMQLQAALRPMRTADLPLTPLENPTLAERYRSAYHSELDDEALEDLRESLLAAMDRFLSDLQGGVDLRFLLAAYGNQSDDTTPLELMWASGNDLLKLAALDLASRVADSPNVLAFGLDRISEIATMPEENIVLVGMGILFLQRQRHRLVVQEKIDRLLISDNPGWFYRKLPEMIPLLAVRPPEAQAGLLDGRRRQRMQRLEERLRQAADEARWALENYPVTE